MNVLKTLRISFLLLAALGACAAAAERTSFAKASANANPPADKSEGKPNIVLIYADDQGWRDIGYQSDGVFKTPVLDQMAKEGMVFTDAYANAANCQPARACILSGNVTPRHHVFAVNSTQRGPQSEMRLIPIPNRDGLAEEDVTIADALKAAGYATGHFGKWHLYSKGGQGGGGALPSQQGFDVTYDSFGEGELPEGTKGNHKGPASDPKGVFDLSKQACNFMEANQDKPFFVYLAHHAPHAPVHSRESTRQRIKDRYQACIYDLDDSVGRVLEKIKELGLESNTLVIYTSDNGGSAHSQKPFRGEKGMYYEGGIRVPMVAHWPGVIKAGSTCSTPVMQVDFFPTYLELAGAEIDKDLDGESLLPLLKQASSLERTSLFWHMPGYLDRPKPGARDEIFRTRPVSVIRKGNWKLHLYLEEWVLDGGRETMSENKAVELYHLEDDIGEHTNLAQQHPEVRDELLADLLAWHDTVHAPIPTKKNPAYDPSTKLEVSKKSKKAKAGEEKKRAQQSTAVNVSVPGRPKGGKPNVIYILADDLGYGDLGCYGQKKLKTPNIDRLATEGLLFSDHYSGNTVCSPSRAVLMTGQHPGHVHCRGNGDERTTALDSGMTTLPRLFKNAGYATGAYGKWGLGQTSDEGAVNPLTHGFDHFSGWKNQGVAHTYYPTSIVRDGREIPLEEGTYIHDLIMKDAFDFIREHAKAKQPFFCYIPTAIPHAAMHAPPELHEKWRKMYPEFDKLIGKYGAPKGEPCPPVQNPVAGFAAMMEHLDKQMGELLRMLSELGVDENTLILFSSDNGAHHAGGHKPEFWDSNGPLRGLKRDLYEGGIRTPMLARWPGKIAAGSESAHISAFWDVLPTMAELIGQPIPDQADGISLLPTLLGKNDQKQHDYLYHEFILVRNKEFTARSLRMGEWKGVQLRDLKTKKLKPLELYNVTDDLGETTNLAAENPELVAKIEGLMDEAHVPRAKRAAKNKAASSAKSRAPPASKPNLLWIVTEDIGCDMASYGTKGVHTPHMDQLAAEGALYTRAYTTASICSPSRSSFMTGLYPHQVFSKNMRIRPPLKKMALPDGVDIFTKYLRDAGYFIGFPGHGKKDWGFKDPKTRPYDSTDWEDVVSKQPFFCQYQFYDTHRVNLKREDGKRYPFLACPDYPVDRSAVELHPYTPESPEAREELGAYLENINLLDIHVGQLIDDLKAKGLYENTIIVVMGDNGPPIFRGKGFLYERGIRMPLIVRVPKKFNPEFKPGTRTDELVSALDMAPTFIHWAGGKIPDYMEGRIFFGPDKQPEPKNLFAMRDRHGMNVDRCRSVCSKEFKYIRNYVRGMTCFENSLPNVAASNAGEKLFKKGKLDAKQAAYYQDKPEEELYDLTKDPFELDNLADDPAYQETLSLFKTELESWMERTGDDGAFEDPAALAEMDRLQEEAKSAK